MFEDLIEFYITITQGRKAALSHMLRTGLYTVEDIQLMEDHQNILSRISDSWQAGDPTLPQGWKIKRWELLYKPIKVSVSQDFQPLLFMIWIHLGSWPAG